MFHEGTKILLGNIINNNTKEIDLNKSKFITYTIDIFNAIQNGASNDEIQLIINDKRKGKSSGELLKIAKMMIEIIIISYTKPFEMIDVIAEKCNLKEKTKEEFEKITKAINQAIKSMQETTKPNSEDDFRSFIQLMEWYYHFCKKSVKEITEELSIETKDYFKRLKTHKIY